MSEQKTIGQIAFEASIGDEIKTPYKVLAPLSKYNWEAAASAVWDKAVEECIETLEIGRGLVDTPPTRQQEFASSERSICIHQLRSLKRSDDNTQGDYLCQGSAGVKGDTVSAPAEPLQADLVAEADWTSGTRWRHKKTGGVYLTVGKCRLESTAEPAVLYRGEEGTVWARAMDEFLDGRFERLAANSQNQLEEPADAGDRMTAASAEASLTPSKTNQDQDND